ncbi:GntR family transcriptional regulator [Dactylosporangium sp. NPDC051541]|uniref:GntR family transcriptional regulator n=1 Tax=Dactylosporangium sp. NPDC051541 TaxID=3363977 RepID=UPI0037905A26
MIDLEGPDPLYLQLAAVLRERIASGAYQPNRPIASVAELQEEFGLARGTILKSIDVLKSEKLVRAVPGRGTFVTPSA